MPTVRVYRRIALLALVSDWIEVIAAKTCLHLGRCKERKCTINLVITLCGAFIVVFMSCCVIVPALKCTLYSVPSTHRAFSLGFKSTITKSFGYLPGTLVFGVVIDQTCKTWIRETCGFRYQCKHYSNKRMAISLALLGFTCRSLSALLCGLSWYAHNQIPDQRAIAKSSSKSPLSPATISIVTAIEGKSCGGDHTCRQWRFL